MLNPSSTLIAIMIALPAVLSQSTNTTTAAAGTSNSSSAEPTPSSTFTATNFTATPASGTTCGTSQQNFNQCIAKVGKDISSCTDNVCLCQTYANIATCYNGCAELASQGEAYQQQATQYCQVAGVKPNTTATTATPATPVASNNTSLTSPVSNTTPIRNSPTSTNSSSNSNTFSAAKGAASSNIATPIGGLFAGFAAAFAIVAS